MEHNNTEKQQHGADANRMLESILDRSKVAGHLKDYTKEFRAGLPDYNPTQFYAPFLITFHDGDEWALYSTTSVRSDRIKGNLWDSYFIKMIGNSTTLALLVYPDGVSSKDKQEAQNQRKKVRDKAFFYSLDDFVSQSELISMIEKKSLANLSAGQSKDILGKSFEQRVVDTLSSIDNLRKWNTPDKPIAGTYFETYKSILGSMLTPDQKIYKIVASSDAEVIGKLPSGGNPKTDVLVNIHLTDDTNKVLTISCKRSVAKAVTVHQYKASAFSEVLDESDTILASLLTAFQENPSLKDFGLDNSEQLEKALEPHLHKLALWVLAGIGGSGDPEKQWATHLLTYNDESDNFSFYTIDEYYQKLVTQNIQGHFGTFFSWTYASKQRGKSIQLKCKII